MPPLDWNKVMAVDPAEVEEDEADSIFELLAEYDPEDEEDTGRLKQLFRVTQSVMSVKAAQAEIALEEVEKQAATAGKADATREHDLVARNKELEDEIKDLKRFGTDAPKDTRFIREEMMELEKQIEILQEDLKGAERELSNEKQQGERYASRVEELEKEVIEVKRENDQLRDEIRDYQNQLDSVRERMHVRRGEDADYKEKIAKKNRELVEALEEIQNLTSANDRLQQQLDDIGKNLDESTKQMARTTQEYAKMKAVISKSDDVIDGMRKENEILKMQVSDLNEQVRSKADADDDIMVAVNNKVEEWKNILAEKDAEVLEYHQQVRRLKEQLMSSNMDTERTSVAVLSKGVQERDKQIELLHNQLDQATNDIEVNLGIIDDLRAELTKAGKGPGDKQMLKIREMQNKLTNMEERLDDSEKRMKQAEDDAAEKDKLLNDALERQRQYEAGEYGLPEAVQEIKDNKLQVNIRDRQIEELTQHVNKCELKINDVFDENEQLRERLGLDPAEPIDLGTFRRAKSAQQQQDRALNQVLQKEVERLEEERVDLKKEIRRLAQQTGQRAVALGLTHDDMLKINDFTEELKAKNKAPSDKSSRRIRDDIELDELKLRNKALVEEMEKNQRGVEKIRQENAEYRLKVKNSDDQNKQLEVGLREISEQIKDLSTTTPGGDMASIDCPILEKMLAAIDAKHATGGDYDTSMYLQARLNNLEGRNDELRKELRESRYECTKAKVEFEKMQGKCEKVEADLQAIRDLGAGIGGPVNAMSLPENMAVTSADVISSLNEHLVLVLQELHLKEDLVKRMEDAMENYKRKFALIRHQQGLLYQDHITEKKAWEDDRKKFEETIKGMEGRLEESNTRLQEFDRLVETLSQDESEVRRRVSETTRKITVLRVNEKALTRRYNAMLEMETAHRRENNRLKNEMIQCERAVMERIGYLQRYKDMAVFKLAHLQRALDESVPSSDLDHANRQFNELTEKYRDLLEKGNSLVQRSEELTALEEEVKYLRIDCENMKKMIATEKERSHTYEAALDELRKQGIKGDAALSDSKVIQVSRRITTLEMKELNERQRADHAQRMYEQYKVTVRDLESRNLELEQKFTELTKMNLEMQKVERELRDELSDCVTREISDADRKRIMEVEEESVNLKSEVSKLKEIAEIGTAQARTLEALQISRDKEVMSLRQQLLDIQQQSDEKTIIGKLHRQIVLLQVSEGTAVRKFEDSKKKITKLEAQMLRLEQKVDEKEQTIYHNKVESRSKAKHLKRTIQSLRRQYSGAVPLTKQERFSRIMVQLQEDKKSMQDELKQIHEQKTTLEDELAQIEMKHESLQDLMVTLKDGKGAQKVAEWHSKMEGLRLEDLKQKRQINRLNQQIKYLDSVIRGHENTIGSMEEDSVKLAKDFEERQLQWEQREVELERMIASMEQMQNEIAGAASEFETAAGCLPDPALPIPNQLEHAIATIKKNVKTILDTQAEARALRKRNQELEHRTKDLERDLITKDKVISELRLRMPATSNRDEIILKATAKATASAARSPDDDYEMTQALNIAQSTVQSLQARVNQKDETIHKYQDLLKAAREDMKEMNRRHEEELQLMQQKLHSKSDAAFIKFKQAAEELINKQAPDVPTNKQLARLNELEDTVAEQDNAVAALVEKLRNAKHEIENWKQKYDDNMRHYETQKDNLIAEHEVEKKELNEKMNGLNREINDLRKEENVLTKEIELQREANERAPTTTMKNMIERLKNQLALKEKQHKSLSKALLDLRADMANQAEICVKATAQEQSAEANVQKLVAKHTKELQDEVETLRGQNLKCKQQLKKCKERENVMTLEVEELQANLNKRETQLNKMKQDKQKLEQEIEELEKRLERLRKAKRGGADDDARHQEAEEMRRKIRLLEDELKRKRLQAEKPFEKDKAAETVVRWEESKKQQKVMDRLKQRMSDREQENEKLSRQLELTKNALDRANKDKESMEARLRLKPEEKITATVASRAMSGKPDHEGQDLKRRNFDLEEELSQVKRQLALGPGIALEEVNVRNKFLTEKLEELERQTARRALQGMSGSEQEAAYRQLLEREQKLHKQVIKLSEENIELRFENEQFHKDVPRMKERIKDLQQYAEVLKHENSEMKGTARSLGSYGSSSGGLRRLGESGKSTRELERTIALLKKVVERVQAENERLKKAPGPVSDDNMQALEIENHGLKIQLDELRQKFGAQLSERYESTQKGTAKMMSDYEKLRKDLRKEVEMNEKLRIEKRQVELAKDQMKKDMEILKGKLEIEEGKRPSASSQGLDSKGWTNAVATRMYEEKVKSLQTELEKKTSHLADAKTMLRDAARREQSLVEQLDEIKEKVTILERFPPGASISDSDLMQEFQQTRLKVNRLENEKRELLHELKLFRHQDRASDESATEDMLSRLAASDRVLNENVELRLQLKSLQLDKDKLQMEVNRLKEELSNFSPEFFEEIEDLKYNYKEAVQKNVLYEEQLKNFSEQFGVSVNIPGL